MQHCALLKTISNSSSSSTQSQLDAASTYTAPSRLERCQLQPVGNAALQQYPCHWHHHLPACVLPSLHRRFVRCIKVVCCQQENYADANKVLFGRRLRIMKVRQLDFGSCLAVSCSCSQRGRYSSHIGWHA